MNHNIITTSSMIHNRDKQYQQRLSAAPATRKHHFLGTLQVLLTAITMLFSLGIQGTWGAERTVTADLSKWTKNLGTGGTVAITDGIANITIGSTKGNAVSLTSDVSYTDITKVEFTVQVSDRGKETLSVTAAGEEFTSTYANSKLTVGTLSISSNNADATGAVTLSSAKDGNVVIKFTQAETSNGKTAVLKNVKITYTDNRTISSQSFAGLKIGSTPLEASKYAVDGNTITLIDSYKLNAPVVKMVKHIVYTDASYEDETVDVENFAYADGFFKGTVIVGGTTYTVKVPVVVLTSVMTDVTGSTTWDWTKTGVTAVQLTNTTYPSKTQEFVLDNLVENTANFNSSALKATTEYVVRDGTYYQGGAIKFNTTVPGKVKVTFANTGSSNADRHIVVNETHGTEVSGSSNSGDRVFSTFDVTAGEVTIVGHDGTNEQYVRIYSIEFTETSSDPDPTPEVISFSMAAETTTAAAHYPTEWEAGHEVQLPQGLPEFTKTNTFYINDAAYGASTSSNDNTAAIQAALNAVPAAGGMVVVPAGTWLSGPLTIKSKTVLHLKDGAVLKLLPFAGVNVVPTAGSGKYPVNNSETQNKFTYKMFLTCADNATDIVVEGEGDGSIIEGQGGDWWPNRDNMGTRPPLIRFQKGSRFLFRNFKLQNSPGTNLALSNSNGASDFTVHNVTIKNPSSIASEATADGYSAVSHNTDGIPVWGARVNIYDCLIDTGDDNIVFDSDSQYGHVWHCTFKRGHGASFGSYTERLHHIIYEDITFDGTSAGFRIKTQRGRSGNETCNTDKDGNEVRLNGSVHDIICRNATMTNVTEPIVLTTHYDQEVDDPEHFASAAVTYQTPEYKDFLFKDITVNSIGNCYSGFNRQRPIYIYGLPEMYIHDITFDNVKITGANTAYLAYCRDIHFTNGTTITNTANPTSVVGTTYTPWEASWTGSLLPSDLAIADGKGTVSISVGDENKALVKGTDYTTSSEGTVTLSSNNEEVVTIVDGKIHAVGAGTAKVTISQAELVANGIYGAGEKEVTVNVTAAPEIRTIYSWESTSGTAEGIEQTGGTATGNLKAVKPNDNIGNIYAAEISDKAALLKTESTHLTITLSNETFKNGDKITIYGFYNKGESKNVSVAILPGKVEGDATDGTDLSSTEGIIICSDVDWPDLKNADAFSTVNHTYSLTDAYDGKDKITITRNSAGTNLYISKIEIKGERAALTASDLAIADGKGTIAMTVGDADKALVKGTDYTTSSTGAVTLSSSDEAVATIVDGKIHAVAAGTATITISQAADANYEAGEAQVTVTVTAAAEPSEVTLYSWESSGPESTDITETGGTIKFIYGDNTNRLNYANDVKLDAENNKRYYTICLTGKKANVNDDEKSSANAARMEITFDKPLKAGDKVAVTAYKNKGDSSKKASIYFLYSANNTEVNGKDSFNDVLSGSNPSGLEPNTIEYVVPDAADGSNKLTLTRNDGATNLFITKLVITGVDRPDDPTPTPTPSYPITATWDFSKAGYTYSGNQFNLTANTGEPLEMTVNNTGVRDNGNSLQFNTGTTLKIPVVSTSDVITVTNYGADGGQYNADFTIGNASATTAQTKDYSPTPAEVETGFVTLTVNNQGYLIKIKLVQQDPTPAPTPEPSYPITATWDFKNEIPATISSVNIQGKTEDVASDKDGISLAVDATVTNGKFAASSNTSGKFAQFNTGTIIRVPVTSKYDVVNVEAFPGQAKYTVGGVAATDKVEHPVSEAEETAGYVEIIATGNGYINSISVTQQGPDYEPEFDWNPTWDGEKWTVTLKENGTDVENAKGLSEALKYLAIDANVAGKNKVLFIPNGTYDLGTKAQTAVPAGATLKGESMEGVIIKNAPEYEGIGITATLQIDGNDVTLENLTLYCRAPYGTTFENNAPKASKAERGVCLVDRGTNNVFRHITLDGLQDTYYSWKTNGANTSYFYDCVLKGSVDFLCGSGNVWFENCTLGVVPGHSDNNGTLSKNAPYIIAPNADNPEFGYIFNNCTIVNGSSVNMDGNYYLGRPWNAKPKASFINTTMKILPKAEGFSIESAGTGSYIASEWTEIGSVDGLGNPVNTNSRMSDVAVISKSKPEAQKLPAPEVTKSGSKITWTAVDGAIAYNVYKDGVFQAKIDVPTSSAAKGMFRTLAAAASPLEYDITGAEDATWTVRAINALRVIGLAQNEEPEVIDPSADIPFSDEALVIKNTNKPFAYATANDRTDPTKVSASNITGGGEYDLETIMEKMEADGGYTVGTTKTIDGHKAIVLQSANTVETIDDKKKETRVPMDDAILNAIKANDIIVLDGSGTSPDFVVSKYIQLSRVSNKTIVGINGARLCTEWYLTDYFKSLLENVPTSSGTGVNSASTAEGTGGYVDVINNKGVEGPEHIKEEGEYLTRKTLLEATGDKTEAYRYSGIFYIDHSSNLIIRNFKFVGPGSLDCAGYDLMAIIDDTHHCWIDHCEFIDGMDGNFDITNRSDFVTVSWCQFRYTDRSYAHQNTNLVGSSDDKTDDRNKLNITFAYNEWGANCRARMPMARFGRIHMLNNYYNCAGNSEYAMNPRKESEFLVEGNYWERGVRRAYNPNGQKAVTWGNNNYYADSAADKAGSNTGDFTVTVPYQYSSIMLDPHKVPEVITLNGGAKLYQKPYFTTNLGVADNVQEVEPGQEKVAPFQHNAELSEELKKDGLVFSVWAENAHTFQWYKQDIALDGTTGEWAMLEGESRNTYTFKPVTGVEFNLKCQAFGVSGETTSDVLKVKIDGLAAPYYLGGMPTEMQTVYTGSPMTFTANFKDATGYQWYKNTTEEIVVDDAHKIEDATSNTYTYDPSSAEIFYLYCVASNSNGKGDGYSDVVKVKGVYRDMKFHYAVDKLENETMDGGTGGISTVTKSPADDGCNAMLITSYSAVEPKINTGGLRFSIPADHVVGHINVAFSNNTAFTASDKLYLKIGTTATTNPNNTYGFYISSSSSVEDKIAEYKIPTNTETGRKEPYEITVVLPEQLVGMHTFYFIPFCPAGKNVNLHEVIVSAPDEIPADDPTVTVETESPVSAKVGNEVVVRITATDAQSYQWYKNSTEELVFDEEHKIAGQTNANLSYTPASEGIEYVYCRVIGKKADTHVDTPIIQLNISEASDRQTGTLAVTWPLVEGEKTYTASPVATLTGDITVENEVLISKSDAETGSQLNAGSNGTGGTKNCTFSDKTVVYYGQYTVKTANITDNSTVHNDAYVKFTFTPKVSFKPEKISFLALINGTGNGCFQPVLVYGNGVGDKKNLDNVLRFKRDSNVKPDETGYEYDLSDITVDPNTPVSLYLYVGGALATDKSICFKEVKIEGQYVKEELTQCLTPSVVKGNWDAEHQQWEYTLSCAQPETAKIHYKIGDADAVEAPTNPVTIKVSEDVAFSVWASDPETDPETKLKDSKTVEMTGAVRPQLAAPSILFATYKVDVPANRGFLVTLTDNNADVENVAIHYTIDGSEPTTESAAYTAPFLVGGDVTVKAIATKNYYTSSNEESAKTLPVNSEGSETTTNKNTNNHYSTVGENVGFAYTYNDNDKTVQNANKLSDGLKFTTNAALSIDGKTGFAIKVNPGFVITKVVATKATTNNDAGSMTFGDVYVDGQKNGNLDKKLPYYGGSNDANAITFTVAENIAAKEKIEVVVTSSDVKNNQANVLFTVFYEFDDAPTGVTITDSKNSEDVITLNETEMTSFMSSHEYTVNVDKMYAEDPIVKIITQKGYEYIVPAGDIETDGDKLTHFTKSFVGVEYTVKAKVNAVKSPNIEIANEMSLKGGYKVTLTYSKEDGIYPYINVDNTGWVAYDPEKEYFALGTVQSKMKYGSEQSLQTVAREASCPSNSYKAGKPFAVYLYVNGYQDGQVGAQIYNQNSFEKEGDKIYAAIANQFNVIPLAVNNSDAILEKRPDINDAKLVVITETLGGSGSVEIPGVGNKSNMMALTLKRDVLDKTNVLNLKMFLNSSSSANNQRWQWAQPRAMTSEITSIMPCTPDGGGMYEIFGNATMSRDASINLWDDISTENMLYHLQPVFNFNDENETRPIFTPLALVIDPEEPEDQREEYHAIHFYKKNGFQYIGFGLSINEWKQYNDNVYAIIDKIGEMIIAGKSLDSKLTGIVKPTITDNGDGSANVFNNNPNADTYYKVYTVTEASALGEGQPTADYIITNGMKANDTDFHTQKYTEKMYIFAVSKLGVDAVSVVVEDSVKGNSIRYVIRENDDPAAQGMVAKYPFDLTVNSGTFNMPYNQSWKKDGYTVTAWEVVNETSGASTSSGTSITRGSIIKPGETISGLTQDITVKAIWSENTKKITDLGKNEDKAARTVTWEFLQSKGAPALAMESKAGNMQAILVGQAKFSDGTFIDVPMTINTDNLATLPDNGTEYHGKFNNTSTNWAAELTDNDKHYTGSDYAQVRTGTQFTFPMVYGSNVVYKGVELVEAVNGVANGNVNRSQISQSYITDGSKTGETLKNWKVANPGYKLDSDGKIVMVDGEAQLATTSPLYEAFKNQMGALGYDNILYDEDNEQNPIGGNFNYGGLIYYNGEATEATLTSMESAQYVHVGATTGKPLGGLNYGSVFMQSLSVTYPELYDLECTWVPENSVLDPDEHPGKIEKLNDPRPNCGGRYVLNDDIVLKLTPAYGYYVDVDNDEVRSGDVVTKEAYYFLKNGMSATSALDITNGGVITTSKIYRYKDAGYAGYSDEIKANIPEDGAYITMKVMDIDLVVSMKKWPTVKYNVEAYPSTLGYITFNTGNGRPHEDEYKEFPVGKTIYITAHPNTGYKFKEWRRNSGDGEILVSQAEYDALPVDGRSGYMVLPAGVTKGDGVMQNPFDPTDFLERDEMMFTVSEANNDFTYVAVFEEGKTGTAHYEFDHALLQTYAGQPHATMTKLEITAEDKNKFPTEASSKALNIPYYYTLFKPGYTLDHWVEIEEEHETNEQTHTPADHVYGKSYRIGTFYYYETVGEVKHLVPVFTKNTTSYDYRATPVDITWDLRVAENAQRMTFKPGVDGTTATTKIYYSTHAKINNGVLIDVPLTITLGKKGKLINDIEEEDKWCAMGEGTTIQIPSGLGAKFTIASLSKMETTTIDGVVPTSYTEETIDDAKVYLYTFTTQSEATSVTLKIGDDYTYYKYIRAELPAADAVPLTVTVNNDAFGTVDIAAARTTADVADNETLLNKINATKTPIQSRALNSGHQYTLGLGTIVSLHAKRSHLYVLDYFEDGDGNRYSAKTVKDEHGVSTVTLCVTDKDGNDITTAAKAVDEYLKMEKVQDFNTIPSLNDLQLTFQVQSYSESMHAVYKENTLYQVNYTSGDEAEGEAPGMTLVEDGESFTIPAENHHLYLDGQTLRYWIDEDGNKYDLGQSYTTNKDLFLTPVFKVNDFTVMNLDAPATATWPLSRQLNDGIVINFEGINGIYVTPLEVKDGEGNVVDFIDLKMDIRGENGKANNVNSTDRCQINTGTVFGLPSSSNCTFTLKSANSSISAKIDGTAVEGQQTVSSDYTGDKTQIEVNFTGNTYLYEVVAQYKPVTTDLPELDYATVGNISLGALGTPLAGVKLSTLKKAGEVSGVPADLSNSTTGIMPVVRGTATRGGYVDVIQATIDNPVATMLVKTRDGVTVSVYKIGFDVTYPDIAPRVTDLKIDRKFQCDLKKMYEKAIEDTRVDGTNYLNDEAYLRHLGVEGDNAENERVAINGVINIKFSTKMAETTLPAATFQANGTGKALGQAVYALEGQTLTFTYKGLDVNTEYDFIIPAGTFKDVFWAETTDVEKKAKHVYNEDIRIHFTTVKTAISTERRVINYVVTHNQASHFDADQAKMVADGEPVQVASNELIENLKAADIPYGTLDEGVKLANAYKEAGKRFYIFVPDGEYQLMGNDSVKSVSSPIGEDGKVISALDGKTNVYSGITTVSRDNVSITGQSQEKTIVYNHPVFEGLSNAATLKLNGGIANFYAQDMTLQNRFDFLRCRKVASKGVAPALWDRSAKPIFKNVKFDSYQDTYYTNANNQLDDTRGYAEDCTIMGYVDFICGDGDHWFQNCDMVVRQGVGSTATNMFAPRQYDTQKWGYVMKKCTFSAENNTAFDVNNGKMTIARPWANSPAETLIECKYDVLSTDDGYKKMTGGGLIMRMQEYKSYDSNGSILDLSKRSLRNSTPGIGSYDAVMTPSKAAEYNLFDVMGGEDGYDPTLYTAQVNMDDKEIKQDDTSLTWDDKSEALCYFLFVSDTENGDYKLFTITAETTFDVDGQNGKWFIVRAANQRGGLGEPTKPKLYEAVDSYKRQLTNNNQVVNDMDGIGWRWSTIYLDFNAKAPTDTWFNRVTGKEEPAIYVYAVTQVNASNLLLKRVKVMEKNCGYIIKAIPRDEDYVFKYTETPAVYFDGEGEMTLSTYVSKKKEYLASKDQTADFNLSRHSLLDGTVKTDGASPAGISSAGVNAFTLSNKIGLGFYKYNGTRLNQYYAWLDASLVAAAQDKEAQGGSSSSSSADSKCMRFIIEEDFDNLTTEIQGVMEESEGLDDHIYNLNGQRINASQMQRGQIYIINGKKIRK